jgi:membrane-bound lytic murein transglycosylase A
MIAGVAAVMAPRLSFAATPRFRSLRFTDLSRWTADDHGVAREVFLRSAQAAGPPGRMTNGQWRRLTQAAQSGGDPRSFFEEWFRPVLLGNPTDALVTGYYEPELNARLTPQGAFQHPIYRLPPERFGQSSPWLTRAEISAGALAGRGLEIAWSDDPVAVFYLHIQGSGRLRLEDGRILRVGYAGKNGRPYRSVGRYMAQEGIFTLAQASQARISAFVSAYPHLGETYLNHNESYVFFEVRSHLSDPDGPIGAVGVPLTPMRSIAVDRTITPLGLPVWLETQTATGAFAQLTVAQDTGSAIKGAQRADLFFGMGADAGRIAGAQKGGGRVVTLMPRSLPLRVSGG